MMSFRKSVVSAWAAKVAASAASVEARALLRVAKVRALLKATDR